MPRTGTGRVTRRIEGNPVGNSPAEFAAIIQQEIVTWTKVVEKAGIKAD